MLIPRFSIRLLLALTAGCALLALMISLAVNGNVVAISFTLALAGAAGMLALQAAFFCLALGGAKIWRFATSSTPTASPFATHTLPPQILPPAEPE